MKKSEVIPLIHSIRKICPAECEVDFDSNLREGGICLVSIQIPIDVEKKHLKPKDYREKFDKIKSNKLTIEGFRCVLGYIGYENIDEDDISDEELAQKLLKENFVFDNLDLPRIIITMEEFFKVHLPDSLYYKWADHESTLTVKQLICDYNNFEQKRSKF